MFQLLTLFLLLSVVYAGYYEEEYERVKRELEAKNIKLTWEHGLNPYFNGKSLEEMNALLGAKHSLKSVLPEKHVVVRDDLPEQFDTREAWPYCKSIKFIRDQSACGSCWAVSTASVLSDRECITSRGTLQPYISDEFLLSCCPICGYGCNGGYVDSALLYWNNSGLPTGGPYGSMDGCQPYSIQCKGCPSQPTPKCKKQCIPWYPKALDDDKHYGQTVYSLRGGPKAYMKEIFQHGSTVAIFTVYSDFFYYKKGVYRFSAGSRRGKHAVRVIGWGVEDDTPYWLVTNSWNETWGDRGLFKIIRGTNDCEFEDQMLAGLPKLQY